MPYKVDKDQDGTVRHKHEGKDPLHSDHSLEAPSQVSCHKAPHMNVESSINLKGVLPLPTKAKIPYVPGRSELD